MFKKAPLFSGGIGGISKDISGQELINCFYCEDPHSNAQAFVQGTPGLVPWAQIGSGVVRGLHVYSESLLAVVVGTKFYTVDIYGTATEKGTITTSTGPVSMADNGQANGKEIMLVDGTEGYIYDVDGDSFNAIADADFVNTADTVVFKDGYFVVNKSSTGEFYWSSTYDGTAWDALDFATAENSPDLLKGIVADASRLWLFGERTTEVWYNAGDVDFVFLRVPGGVIERGTLAPFSAKRFDGTVVWLSRDDDGGLEVVRATGESAFQVISTPELVETWSTLGVTGAHAWSYVYNDQGREFYVINFPEGTWAYCANTQRWHRMSNWTSQGHERHRAQYHAYFNGKHIVGSHDSNDLWVLERDAYENDKDPIRREIRGVHLKQDENRLFIAEVQVQMEEGVGNLEDLAPTLTLSWSKDGGHTYNDGMTGNIGYAGDRGSRVVFRKLGMARDWVFCLTMDSPVKFVVEGMVVRPRGS